MGCTFDTSNQSRQLPRRSTTFAGRDDSRKVWRIDRSGSVGRLLWGLVGGLILMGCRAQSEICFDNSLAHYQAIATQIEYPDADVETAPEVTGTLPPRTVRQPGTSEFWPMTLEEAIRIALANSQVMRDVGGRVVTSPTSISTIYDPAIQETHPLTGPEAALSAFDAQFSTGVFWERNERTFNNFFDGGGINSLHQNRARFHADITKTAATGTQFSIRNFTDYDSNSSPFNRFPSAYDTAIEAGVRQPLLQGNGIEFNRIAGPNARPGQYHGVLIGRVNTDMALADFEAAVRDVLREVERAYWELYFAYRDLDARIAGREAALETWRKVQAQLELGMSDDEREALAREQYYAAVAQVENSLNGAPTGYPDSGLGRTVFSDERRLRGELITGRSGGVYTVERRLRFLMGLTASDGLLIRPADEPSRVDLAFDWYDSLQQAVLRRVELRKQKWLIKRRELELMASRNFLQMRLDAFGHYRWRGFGDGLLGNRDVPNGSAWDDLFTGDLQEWRLGVELSTPVGNRIGHTAVRNAELALARERAIYQQQQLQVSHELSSAFGELDRAYAVTRSNYNRRIAAHQQLDAVRAKYEVERVPLEFVFDAERRATEGDSAYYRSLVDYNQAIANVYYARGAYLEYVGVHLAEAPWSEWAHASAAKQSRQFGPHVLNHCLSKPRPVSLGAYPQSFAPQGDSLPTLAPYPDNTDPTSPERIPAPEPAPTG
jgi:outer membrane protein TolC